MSDKKPFVFVGSWIKRDIFDDLITETEMCRYRLSFWEEPIEADQTGRYVQIVSETPFYRDKGSFLNVSPSVSFYDELKKAMRKKPSSVVTRDFRKPFL